jgi:hypothetical protein
MSLAVYNCSRIVWPSRLIRAARLLMPALMQTERPVRPALRPGIMGSQYVAEPLLLSSVASPEQWFVEQEPNKISRQIQAANPERIAAAMAKAQDGIRRAEADIARMEALDSGD